MIKRNLSSPSREEIRRELLSSSVPSPIALSPDDLDATLNRFQACSLLVVEAPALRDAMEELTTLVVPSHASRVLLSIRLNSGIELSMGDFSIVSHFASSFPTETDILWGVAVDNSITSTITVAALVCNQHS